MDIKRKSIIALAFGFLYLCLLATVTCAQTNNAKPCNKSRSFCWYGDEIEAWGSVWKSDDPSEKSLKQVTEVRCIKRLSVCIQARNQPLPFESSTMTNIDIYNVRSWDDTEIRAVMDEQTDPACEQDTLVINRVEQSVLTISSPGPLGNEKRCMSGIGPPKTVVYRLSDQK